MSNYDDMLKEINYSNDVNFEPNLEDRSINNNDDNDAITVENSQTHEDVLNKKHQNNQSNNYNPSNGNFLPHLTEEIENMIKNLKIDSANKISNDDRNDTLIAVIDCLLYHHYNSIDFELLHDFFFEFNQKLCENPLEKNEMEELWVQETALIEISCDEKIRSLNDNQNIKKEHTQFNKDLINDKKEIQENTATKTTTYEENIAIEEWRITLLQYYSELKEAAEKNFPDLWESVEFVLSVKNILHIKNCTLPFAGILLGSPSSSKTIGLELLRNSSNTFYTDSFSAKSFVSHSTSIKREDLVHVDLLPKIKNKIFLSPELSPIFSKKDDEVVEILGIFIRVLDGRGYESDTGAHGHRGYTGEFMFVWVGAAVDVPRKVHKYLAALGPKLYFYKFLNPRKQNRIISMNLKVKSLALNLKKLKTS